MQLVVTTQERQQDDGARQCPQREARRAAAAGGGGHRGVPPDAVGRGEGERVDVAVAVAVAGGGDGLRDEVGPHQCARLEDQLASDAASGGEAQDVAVAVAGLQVTGAAVGVAWDVVRDLDTQDQRVLG